MGSHFDSVLESGGPLRQRSRTAQRLHFGSIYSGGGAHDSRPKSGRVRISWPKSTVAPTAGIQAEDREVRVGVNNGLPGNVGYWCRLCENVHEAKDAQNCFLNCLLSTQAASTIGFYIDEIEMEILHAS
jgi:hypothetical protein